MNLGSQPKIFLSNKSSEFVLSGYRGFPTIFSERSVFIDTRRIVHSVIGVPTVSVICKDNRARPGERDGLIDQGTRSFFFFQVSGGVRGISILFNREFVRIDSHLFKRQARKIFCKSKLVFSKKNIFLRKISFLFGTLLSPGIVHLFSGSFCGTIFL